MGVGLVLDAKPQIEKISYGTGHLNHVFSVNKIYEMTQLERRYKAANLPVCNHCERLALWDRPTATGKNVGTCLHCGTRTIDPIKYSEYLVAGYDLSMDMDAETKERICVERSLQIDDL
jgi:hypothetical protein